MNGDPVTREFTLLDGTKVLADREKHSVTISLASGATMSLVYADGEGGPGHRQCGTCSLCCRLLPIPEVHKVAGVRCTLSRHRAGGCCTIYGRPEFPRSCAQWSCRWLVDPELAARRPDRAHYVVDVVPDTITAQYADGSEHQVSVVQIWQDPAYPQAHRDPRLRAWIAANALLTGMAAIVRTGRDRDVMLGPPSMTDNGEWFEYEVQPHLSAGLWNTPATP